MSVLTEVWNLDLMLFLSDIQWSDWLQKSLLNLNIIMAGSYFDGPCTNTMFTRLKRNMKKNQCNYIAILWRKKSLWINDDWIKHLLLNCFKTNIVTVACGKIVRRLKKMEPNKPFQFLSNMPLTEYWSK